MPVSAVTCDNITVKFGDFVAIDRVSVAFEPGRIHALVGQNGAGKTTLARVVAGIVAPAAGQVLVAGAGVSGGVLEARARGVEMVHQSFALPPSMTVAEALEYGSTRRVGRIFSRRSLNARWQEYLDRTGVTVSAGAPLRDLPIETLQAVEIARALAGDAKVLILDEPTAVLPPNAVGRLFDNIRRLRDSGVTVIVVLHKVREVLEIAETVTVLRRGELILDTVPSGSLTPRGFADAIIGSENSTEDDAAVLGLAEAMPPVAVAGTPAPSQRGPVLARLDAVTSPDSSGGAGLRTASLDLHAGEMVGVAGVEGNGQVALVEVLAGLSPASRGVVEISGEDMTHRGLLERRARGLRIIPFDRNTQGLSSASPLWQNWATPLMVGSRRRRGMVRAAQLRREATAALEAWDVRFTSVNQPAASLSGGNAQKVILARELDDGASVIVAAQPTRGLDLGAVEFVWRALRKSRGSGASVLLISSDLDELAEVCDRIVVVLGGAVVLDVAAPFDIGRIGAAMTGAAA